MTALKSANCTRNANPFGVRSYPFNPFRESADSVTGLGVPGGQFRSIRSENPLTAALLDISAVCCILYATSFRV